jgi:hypothetical protein
MDLAPDQADTVELGRSVFSIPRAPPYRAREVQAMTRQLAAAQVEVALAKPLLALPCEVEGEGLREGERAGPEPHRHGSHRARGQRTVACPRVVSDERIPRIAKGPARRADQPRGPLVSCSSEWRASGSLSG